MAELIIFVLIGAGLIALHFVAAVAYKLKTKSRRSIWWIMDNEI